MALPTLLGSPTRITYGLHGDSDASTCWNKTAAEFCKFGSYPSRNTLHVLALLGVVGSVSTRLRRGNCFNCSDKRKDDFTLSCIVACIKTVFFKIFVHFRRQFELFSNNRQKSNYCSFFQRVNWCWVFNNECFPIEMPGTIKLQASRESHWGLGRRGELRKWQDYLVWKG